MEQNKLQDALDILEEIATSLGATMAPFATNLAGEEMPSKKYDKEGKLKSRSMDKRYKFKIRINGSNKKEDKVQ